MIAVEEAIVNSQKQFQALQDSVHPMTAPDQDAHTVEQGLWAGVLKLGQALLTVYLAGQGDGDVGDQLPLTDEPPLPQVGVHKKCYRSVFGPIEVERMCYGRGQIEAVPLDAKLNLPKHEYSYLLQQWGQGFCVQDAFGEAVTKIEDLLSIRPTVRTLENLNRYAAKSVAGFQDAQPAPDPATEGELLVATADGKGVPMCRDVPPPKGSGHRLKKGEKKQKKKIACVGAVYTIDRFPRTADEVIDEVLRDQAQQRRPKPQHKQVQAHLIGGKEATFRWLGQAIETRNPTGCKQVLCLCDGERALWRIKQAYLAGAIEILDLFHALEKLWLAAHCFHQEGSPEAAQFVEQQLRRLLEGQVGGVIRGLRQMATEHPLRGQKQKTIEQVSGYFQHNRHRMRYDEYLAAGYPIGSGVVEGACRHLVKDRLERTGMRWKLEGAQAMLALRATYLNGHWSAFWDHHMRQQGDLLYGQIDATALEPLAKAA